MAKVVEKQLVAQLVQINLFVMFMVASFGWSADSFASQASASFRRIRSHETWCQLYFYVSRASKQVGKLTN